MPKSLTESILGIAVSKHKPIIGADDFKPSAAAVENLLSNGSGPEISCDRCAIPGACCKQIFLSSPTDSARFRYPASATVADVQKDLYEVWLPFVPLRPSIPDDYKEGDTLAWSFTCPKLGDNGRCTIYDNRPGLCRRYEAGSDTLCVHFRQSNGQPVVPQLPSLPIANAAQ